MNLNIILNFNPNNAIIINLNILYRFIFIIQKQKKDGQEAFMTGAKTNGNGQRQDVKFDTTDLKLYNILIIAKMINGSVYHQIQILTTNGMHKAAYKKKTLYVKQNLNQNV